MFAAGFGRSADKIQKVQQELARQGGQISSYTCDLASLSQIRQFAEAVKANHKSIDVLINNAGVFETRKSLSEDGFELTWAVNVLAPFLLTALLKDIVTERIVNVSSISAGSRIDFDNLQQVKHFPARQFAPAAAYLKLSANVCYTKCNMSICCYVVNKKMGPAKPILSGLT